MPDPAGNVLAPTPALLTATDGSPDKFRIKIWKTADESIVYDNQIGGSDTADPTTAIAGGSIQIHKG